MSDDTLKNELAGVLLDKTVIHKKTGVIGTPKRVFAPGECPQNTNPDLPTPTDVFVVEFEEGHKFMVTPATVYKVGEIFDVLDPKESNFVKVSISTLMMSVKELGGLASVLRVSKERAYVLTCSILREMVRVLES